MQRINQQYVDQATGVYFDNRYFLAVPLDGAVENSHLLVYNFINQGWESIDSINSLTFNVRDMVVGREGSQNFLYLISSTGSIHKYEGHEGGDQVTTATASSLPQILDVSSELRTREYAFKTINRKNFNRAEIHMKSSPFSKSNGTIPSVRIFTFLDGTRYYSRFTSRSKAYGTTGWRSFCYIGFK